MTTITASQRPVAGAAAPRTPLHRVLNVVKLQLGNPQTTIVMPWLILGFIFLVNVAIWVIINAATSGQATADARKGLQYSGASFYIFIYMLVVAIQAFSITFRFAIGFGSTRRDYWLGSAVTFVILAAIFAVGITILSVIEVATGGWWLGGRMFSPIYFGDVWWQRLLVFFFGLLFVLFVGSLFAAVWVRWKATGMIVLFGVIGLLALAVIAIMTLSGSWGAFGAALAGTTPLGLASWLLVPAAIAALAGFLILRRATARA